MFPEGRKQGTAHTKYGGLGPCESSLKTLYQHACQGQRCCCWRRKSASFPQSELPIPEQRGDEGPICFVPSFPPSGYIGCAHNPQFPFGTLDTTHTKRRYYHHQGHEATDTGGDAQFDAAKKATDTCCRLLFSMRIIKLYSPNRIQLQTQKTGFLGWGERALFSVYDKNQRLQVCYQPGCVCLCLMSSVR